MTVSSDNTRAALIMMAGMAAFTINDAFMKSLADEVPLFQAIFLRGVATSIFLLLLARAMRSLRFDFGRRDWCLLGIRSVSEIGAAFFFITALFNMPLANATAILQSLPLTVTLAGAVFLGEAVGWRRLTAILMGFIGVLLIVRPGAEGFNAYSLYALAAVACVTVRDLMTRQLDLAVPSLTVALVASLGVTLFGALGSATTGWAPISPLAVAQLLGATVFIILGYLCSVLVMRIGDIGFSAPFRYTGLLWALLLGLLVFGHWPERLTLLGAAIVTATGIFTLYRERHFGKAGPQTLRVR